ncbi:MAG: UBA/THIF-type binding protein [Caulobacter sp.]|nr:UBA/THIF-type binding protein [Caulobacter sp.]
MSDRYARHQLIDGWRQEDLTRACVAIAGVGAIGNAVALALALSGVGRLILCDPDTVQPSNLSRTPLFQGDDVGRLKADAAAARLRALAPDLAVEARAGRFEACVGLGTPYIDAATQPWGGEVRPHVDLDGPCFACGLSDVERGVLDTPWSCLDLSSPETAGAAAPSSGLIGNWAALMAVRTLCGMSPANETLVVDGAGGEIRRLVQARDPTCWFHRPIEDTLDLQATVDATLEALRVELPAGVQPLLWRPIEREAQCRQCGWTERVCRVAIPRPCPNCDSALDLETSLETEAAPGHLTLREIGVAPREILAARAPEGRIWLRLSAESSAG